MKIWIKIGLFIIVAGFIAWGLIAPNGIHTVVANNLWSLKYIKHNFDSPLTLSSLSSPPAAHAHAGMFLARKALNSGCLVQAEAYLAPLAQRGDSLVLSLLADVLYKQEKYLDAIKIWESLNDEIKLGIAAAKFTNYQNYDLVLSAVQSLYNIDPSRYTNRLVSTLSNQKNYERALSILILSTEEYPDSPDYVNWLKTMGDIYVIQQKWFEAESVYHQIIEIDYNNWRVWKSLGWLNYEYYHNIESAIECFNKINEINPDGVNGYYEIGLVYSKENNPVEAMEYFEKAVLINPDNRRYHLTYANSLRDYGHLNLSIEKYREIISLFPDEGEANAELSRAYWLNDQPFEAIESIENALDLNPLNIGFLLQAGRYYEQTGSIENALNIYRQVIKIDATNTIALQGIDRLSEFN